MNIVLRTLLIAGVALSLTATGGADALAKGHDQGGGNGVRDGHDGVPGGNAGTETAGPAQGLGGARGEGRGPADTPAGAAPGESESAGRR